MSTNINFKNFSITKLPNKSGIKPRNNLRINTFNNKNYFVNTKKFDINRLNRMKPKYKKLYNDLIHRKINSECKNVIKDEPNPGNNIDLCFKTNSFLDNSIMNKDRKILFQLNKLKMKIFKNKNHSYFSVNKNIEKNFEDNPILKSFQNSSFLAYKSFDKYSKNRFGKKMNNYNLINIKNNSVNNINNNNIKLVIKKYQNDGYGSDINKAKKEKNKEACLQKSNKLNHEEEEKKLISENSKLKKELEYSNSQLEKYKKYQTLYLNLLKKVKSNKNLIKNINLNVDKNIKEEYINDLIERGKEINTMLKEDNILENNIKNMLYKLE